MPTAFIKVSGEKISGIMFSYAMSECLLAQKSMLDLGDFENMADVHWLTEEELTNQIMVNGRDIIVTIPVSFKTETDMIYFKMKFADEFNLVSYP